ncbi:hypothetical protein SEA_HUWBERT_10 [Microbacterium phage Huwbert]|nr:hypothetical protein SEA_HUWBERT_10 [Microbacterium phage Huwbert]
MQPSPLPPPSLDILAPSLDDAIEATYLVTNNLVDEDSRAAEVAYNTQTILALLKFVVENPDEGNLARNFGQLTLDALDSYRAQIEHHPIAVARAIGRELLEIESAIEQGSTAYGNAHFRDQDYIKANFYDSPLFTQLSARREKLRNALLDIDWTAP